jgi:hypothetical protein
MNTRGIALLATALLAGCSSQDVWRTDTAQMPLNADGGPKLNESEAIALARWALKDPANTAGNSERAARAIAAEDWLAGQDMLTNQFGNYAPVNEVTWSVFRREVRASIGVLPEAPSQVLIEHLFAAADALKAGQTEAAATQLANPIFTLGPHQTLAALANLPPLSDGEWAFAGLARNDDRSTGTPKGIIRF